LGYFVPSDSSTPLWELENDYYLHNTVVQTGGGATMTEILRRSNFQPSDDEAEADNDSSDNSESR